MGIPFVEALGLEGLGFWDGFSAWRAFWSQLGIPEELQADRGPDAEGFGDYQRGYCDQKQARLTWLDSQVASE